MHNEVYRHFLWFEVAYIDNPDTVNASLVCQIQLFANLGCSCCVYPSARMPVVLKEGQAYERIG